VNLTSPALVATRDRLVLRFGRTVEPWWDRLPDTLDVLASRWQLTIADAVGRGNTALVLRCQRNDGRAGILKLSPEQALTRAEESALRSWQSSGHVPAVWERDVALSALLLEAMPSEVPLSESATGAEPSEVAQLIAALHRTGVPRDVAGAVPLIARVDFIFEYWSTRLRAGGQRSALLSLDDIERGRELAGALASDGASAVLFHGDLHPGNVLLGGRGRGLVAIEPRPCVGDAAFDVMDWVFWSSSNPAEWEPASRNLAAMLGYDPARLWSWARAFAALLAAIKAARGAAGDGVEALLAIAA
jgi:streptomycin 6-kinase